MVCFRILRCILSVSSSDLTLSHSSIPSEELSAAATMAYYVSAYKLLEDPKYFTKDYFRNTNSQ
jgi:hypothetical protein